MGKFKADLDLHKLEIFYWVAEMRSFSQAADLLSLRQPTVSAHIQELEQSVGGKLLYRIRGRVSLTPLGQLLAERAKNLLAFKRETVAAVELFHGTLSGELWIGGSNIPGEYFLPQRLGAFTRKFPAVRPILRIGMRYLQLPLILTPICCRVRNSIKHGRNKWLKTTRRRFPSSRWKRSKHRTRNFAAS